MAGQHRGVAWRRRAAAVVSSLSILSGGLLMISPALGADAPPTLVVGGLVFDDKNVDGIFDNVAQGNAREGGVNGVTVTAYDISGAAVGSDVTHTIAKVKGAWSIPTDVPVRIEFSNYPKGFVSSVHGPAPSPGGYDSGTSVQFASPDDVHVNFGIRSDDTRECETTEVEVEVDDRRASRSSKDDDCPTAPTEIGNFVWNDTNANGIQDPGEAGLGGVTVNLYDAKSSLVDSTITDPGGLYYFLIDPALSYVLRLDNLDDSSVGAPLENLFPSPIEIQGPGGALHDSNDPTGTTVPSGVAGTSDHTYDFGFYRASYSVVKGVYDPSNGSFRDANTLDDAPTYAVGSSAVYIFVVENTGDVALSGVTVADPFCTSAISPSPIDVKILVGEQLVFSCLHALLTKSDDGHINTVTVSGATPSTTDGETVGKPISGATELPSNTDIAIIKVLKPELKIRKFVLAHGGDPKNLTGASVAPGDFGINNQWIDADTVAGAALLSQGDTPHWAIVVTNTGETDLSLVTVNDLVAPLCNRDIGFLAPGQTEAYFCSSAEITTFTNVTNSATASATPTLNEMPFPTDGENTLTIDAVENPASYRVAHPSIDIRKRLKDTFDGETHVPDVVSVVPGGSVTFPIVVTNAGNVALHDVVVVDGNHPECSAKIGELAVGASHSYDCTVSEIGASIIDHAVATGTDPNSSAVTDSDQLDIRVVPVGLTVTKLVRVRGEGNYSHDVTVPVLGVAQWQITVANTSTVADTHDGALINPAFADSVAPECVTALDQALADYDSQPTKVRPPWAAASDTFLLQGDSIVATCELPITATNGATGQITNTVHVDASVKLGEKLSATDSAQVHVPRASIRIIKEIYDLNGDPVKAAILTSGSAIVWHITVINNGVDPLTNVTVADPAAPTCATALENLASGEIDQYTCTSANFTADLTNTATVTGAGTDGAPVTASDSAQATATVASISILKEVFDPVSAAWKDGDSIAGSPGSNLGDSGSFGVGGNAQFRITVMNTGQAPLRSAHVTDSWCGLDQTVDLAPAGSPNGTDKATMTCTRTNLLLVDNGHINTAQVSGARPEFGQGANAILGKPLVEVSETAQVKVSTPKLSLKKYILRKGGQASPLDPATNPNWLDANQPATGASYVNGDTVQYLLVVTNSGSIAIDHVRVVDVQVPACTRDEVAVPGLAVMAPGASVAWQCSLASVSASFVNTAGAFGQPDLGGQLQPDVPLAKSTDTATVTVVEVQGTTVTRKPTVVFGGALAATGSRSEAAMQFGLALVLLGMTVLTPTIVGNHRRRVRPIR